MDMEEYWEKVYFIIDNSIFIRSGECKQCGECCIAYDKHPLEGGKRVPCKHLVGNLCEVHDQKATICPIAEMNPIYPTPCMVPDAVKTCGYSWVVNDKLTKAEALEKFNRLCDMCHRKAGCEYYNTIINEVNTKCISE